MSTAVHLLGPPRVIRNGTILNGPRGRKAWGLLAFLVLAQRPPSRQRLVSLLFERADDPRGALRWNLAEIRRTLDGTVTIGGDPLTLDLSAQVSIDIADLAAAVHATEDGPPHGELLEGLTFDDSPAFDTWLAMERRRLAADSRAIAYRWSVELLAHGEPETAAQIAARAVESDPFNTDLHAVIVSSLMRAGDPASARAYIARCADVYRRELGTALPAAIANAATTASTGAPVSAAAIRSLLDLADASLSAGAAAAGIDQLRRAVAGARDDEPHLSARARLALASALIHTQGGRGGEVVTLLHEARANAERCADTTVGAAACRELAFLAVQKGHRAEVEHWLSQAEQWGPSTAENSRILGVRGMSLSDSGDYDAASHALATSLDAARSTGDRRQVAWSEAMLGRVHLLRGEASQAALVLDDALAIIQAERWTAFAPFPQALRAEAAVALDDNTTARDLLEYAWIQATESADQCWVAAVTHAHGVLARREGRDALTWCRTGLAAEPWYTWMRARLLDLAADLTLGQPESIGLVDELEQLAGAGAMRELMVRALIHRSRTGDPMQITRARAIALDIPNPILHQALKHETPHDQGVSQI